MQRLFWLILFALFFVSPAHAQSTVRLCVMTSSTHCEPVTSGAPLPVNASVTASIAGFAPSTAYATCTATNSQCSSTALPTNTGTVILFNAGTTTVSCNVASGAATAAANEIQIPASSGLPVSTTYGATTYDHFACIDQTGSTSNLVVASGGSGLGAGWGGGGGGSSSNASVGSTGSSVPSSATYLGLGSGGNLAGWPGDATNGAWVNVKTSVLPTGAGTSANQTTINTSLGTINTTLGTPMQNSGGSVTANLGTLNGAATAALQTTGNSTLSTINTTLGSPFQAGGSIGNTSFAVTQSTSSSLKGQFDPLTIATWGLMSGTTPGTAPTNTQIAGAIYNSSAPSPSNGQTLPLQSDSSGRLIVSCGSGCGGSGGTSVADEGTFTQGTTSLTPIGGVYATSITNLTANQAGAVRLTNDRKMMVDTPNVEVANGGASAATSAIQAGGVYNSSAPSLSNGQGAALQITAAGSLHTTVDNTNANGSATSANSAPVVIASDQGAVAVKQTTASNLNAAVVGVGSAGSASGGVLTVQGVASMTPVLVQPQAAASGGASNYGPLYSAASNNATNVKSSAGTLYSVTVTQSTTTAMELKLYNTSSSPTCSSATGIIDNIPIPSNATSPGYHLTYPVGRAFSTGISFCLVAFGNPASSTDNSNAATGVTVSMTYD